MKLPKQLERHFKGVSNHRRIQILVIIENSDGISLDGITQKIAGNLKTISEHVRRLLHAGLITKKYKGRKVAHSLSPYGKRIFNFIKLF